MKKSLYGSCCLGFLLASCASAGEGLAPAQGEIDRSLASAVYFDVDQSQLPAQHREKVVRAVLQVDETFPAEPFLARLKAKSDWTFTEPAATGDELVRRVRDRQDENDATVRPRLSFYTPPGWGKDTCGGWSFGPFRRTSSTGCTDNAGNIKISLEHISNDPTAVAEFLAHEWMHAADYRHGDNNNQHTAQKRNSVPIHVGCLVRSYPNTSRMDLCALSLKDAQEQTSLP
ncbi:MAG TPA: hypothetical protein VFR37_05925 [Longimicrobium sp.]|nr:hypothetical protein [Longimicrobium sp.]